MKGRLFLEPARDLLAGPTEAHHRAAAGRAYYAAFQEAHSALKRWGVVIPARENIHAFVRLRFLYAGNPDAQWIGRSLETLVNLRNEADYKLAAPGSFRDAKDLPTPSIRQATSSNCSTPSSPTPPDAPKSSRRSRGNGPERGGEPAGTIRLLYYVQTCSPAGT